jgi:MFS family permease
MMGQYPAAAGVGYLTDRYGPWLCSLNAAILFGVGFGLFSLECERTPAVDDLHHSARTSFYLLTFFFLLCGFGTVNR